MKSKDYKYNQLINWLINISKKNMLIKEVANEFNQLNVDIENGLQELKDKIHSENSTESEH